MLRPLIIGTSAQDEMSVKSLVVVVVGMLAIPTSGGRFRGRNLTPAGGCLLRHGEH